MGGYATQVDPNSASEITGSGTANYVAKFTAAQVIGNSLIYDDGTNVAIGTTSPGAKLDVRGTTGSGELLLQLYSTDWATVGERSRLYLTQGIFFVRANTYSFYASDDAGNASVTLRGDNASLAMYSQGSAANTFLITNSTRPLVSAPVSNTIATTSSWIFGTNAAPNAFVEARGTTEQIRAAYDATNYLSTTVGSTGVVTRNASGTVASHKWTTDAMSSGTVTSFTFTQPANTGQTASTEVSGWRYVGATRTWATGALTTQREVYISSSTYAFAGASTITDAYGLYVEAPTAGSNATITNNWALGTNGNIIAISGTGTIKVQNWVGVANTQALYFNQTTPSVSNYTLAATASSTYLNGNAELNLMSSNSAMLTINRSNSSSVNKWVYSGGAVTNKTASTEVSGLLWTTGSSQWATGALTTQREFRIVTPTYSFVGASTISEAYTLYVEAPTAGTNATITNNFALGLSNGSYSIKMGQLTGSSTVGAIYMLPLATTVDATNYTLKADGTDIFLNAQLDTSLYIRNGNNTRIRIGNYFQVYSPGAATSGSTIPFTFTVPSATGQTASTEIPSFKITGATTTWAAGAITTQRFNYISASTAAFASASTITSAYGLYVEAPTAGSNATITNNYSLGLSGSLRMVTGRVLENQGADVASATDMVLGTDGNTFEITGTTTIDHISNLGWQNGARIILVFNASLTVSHGVATSGTNVTILLAGAANFSATANDTLTLVLCENTASGQAWREVARAAI